MIPQLSPQKNNQKEIIKASLFNFKNLFVLATGIVAGWIFSPLLIPIGAIAYGVMCYLDVSSEEFVKKVLTSKKGSSTTNLHGEEIPLSSGEQSAPELTIQELQDLQEKIFNTKEKIGQLHEDTDDFTRRLLGDISQTENLVAKSYKFLQKAQRLRNYLSSENVAQITQDITSLQEKIQQVSDDFSKHQYQQALTSRQKHLETLQDLERMYERLVSQLTNISISLESIYSRMMKLKTLEYSLASAESDQVAIQLNTMLQDMEQLDSALKETLSLTG
jgi:hypothetical protein